MHNSGWLAASAIQYVWAKPAVHTIGKRPIHRDRMQPEPNCTDHHKKRSEFIRNLVQKSRAPQTTNNETLDVPTTIVQFWHDLGELPEHVR